MGAIRRAGSQRAVPALNVWQVGPRDVDVEISIHGSPDRNVRKREILAEQKLAVGQNRVEQSKMLSAAPHLYVDRRHVSLRGGGARGTPAKPPEGNPVERGL